VSKNAIKCLIKTRCSVLNRNLCVPGQTYCCRCLGWSWCARMERALRLKNYEDSLPSKESKNEISSGSRRVMQANGRRNVLALLRNGGSRQQVRGRHASGASLFAPSMI